MTGVCSCSLSSVVAVACIVFSYFWRTNGHITHSKSDISICNNRSTWLKIRQKADNVYACDFSSMKCFT
ncbi:hypothetical protein WM46_20590 [Citrobacter freundii complex sp. CFNIH2]|nr:hypothetical protein WM46_20590 [Citrobacter freundii complex sp. CFNIH2]AVI00427.1 hypothetical protein AL479_23155 [Citrobacter amalonaticus]